MENKKIIDYLTLKGLNVNQIVEEYYGYIYRIATNSKGINITHEDVEEIISDTFFALWKNSNKLAPDILIKPYLTGIVKNVIRNKYRTIELAYSIEDYESEIKGIGNLEEIIEEREKIKIIQETLRKMKKDDYEIFFMFYYEGMKTKDIAMKKNFSENKVKLILFRVRKKIKKNLKNRGYYYGK